MKRPRGGSLFLLLAPDELLARIATIVPPPRTHGLRYHGVFAPNSRVRGLVVPERSSESPSPAALPHPHARSETSSAPPRSPKAPPAPEPRSSPQSPNSSPRTRVPWAELLQKVFAVDVLACARCAGRLEVIAYIAEPTVAAQILDDLGLQAQAPPLAKAGEAEEQAEPGPGYDLVDPTYDE